MSESVELWSGKDRGDENFPVGSWAIAKRLRGPVHAFYTFARNADDIADSDELAAAEKVCRLDVMAAVLRGERDDGSPSAAALRASLGATRTTDAHALELLVAFRQDADTRRYATWDELIGYCRYSAMPVGRHVLDLHGEGLDTWAPSDALCSALQIENHLQDCGADLARLDRCYVPEDWLRESGASVEDVRAPSTTPALRRVFDRMLDGCDALNATASDLPRRVRDRRLRFETAVIVGLSRRLARRLRAGDPLAMRVKLTRGDVTAAVAGALRVLP